MRIRVPVRLGLGLAIAIWAIGAACPAAAVDVSGKWLIAFPSVGPVAGDVAESAGNLSIDLVYPFEGTIDANGYFRDKLLAAGPFKSATVRAGKGFTFAGKGAQLHHMLTEDPSPVDLVVQIGAQTSCLGFGGTTRVAVGSIFQATTAPPPSACAP